LFEHFNPGVAVPARFRRILEADFDHPTWELAMARKDARLMQAEADAGGIALSLLPAFVPRMGRPSPGGPPPAPPGPSARRPSPGGLLQALDDVPAVGARLRLPGRHADLADLEPEADVA